MSRLLGESIILRKKIAFVEVIFFLIGHTRYQKVENFLLTSKTKT
jgi:hypothetical protein